MFYYSSSVEVNGNSMVRVAQEKFMEKCTMKHLKDWQDFQV